MTSSTDQLAPEPTTASEPDANSPLIGLWSLGGPKGWQGRIVAQLGPDSYLAQLYDWVVGSPSTLKVFTIETLADLGHEFDFYQHHEEWLEGGEILTRRNASTVADEQPCASSK